VAKPNFIQLDRHVVEAMLAAKLSGSEYRALMLIVEEHLKHAGKDNGKLIVTQKDFINTGGIAHDSVAGAIRGLVAKGFIDVRGGEYNAGTGRRNHKVFTLAFLNGKRRDRNVSVLCQTEKQDKSQTGKQDHTQTGKQDHTAQTEKQDNYLEKDLPYPPNAVGQTDPTRSQHDVGG
jgi:DNA-binding MarR family transcriptional regulator